MTRCIALLLLLPLVLSLAPTRGGAPKPITVIVVRHAETVESTEGASDPTLSEDGAQRARELARLLSASGVTHLLSSEYVRTQSTLAPLAEAAGVAVEVISARETDRCVERLRGLEPGSVVVVAGHSNTVPGLVDLLGGEVRDLHEGRLDHDSYDRMFIVTLPRVDGAGVQTIELRYGE